MPAHTERYRTTAASTFPIRRLVPRGGSVELLGSQVELLGQARVDASGDAGGGTVLVGGDSHGTNTEVRDASFTYVGPNVQVSANATGGGNGGRIVVWSNDETVVQGSLGALGGPGASGGGNGGLVETSSAKPWTYPMLT